MMKENESDVNQQREWRSRSRFHSRFVPLEGVNILNIGSFQA